MQVRHREVLAHSPFVPTVVAISRVARVADPKDRYRSQHRPAERAAAVETRPA
jgi:hypothetical protein